MTRNTAARGISPSPPQPPMGTPRDAARSAVSAAGSSRRAAELRPPRCHPRCAATGPGKGLRSAGAEPQPQPGDAPGSPAPRGQPPPTTPAPHSPHRTAPLRRRPPPPRGSPAHGGVIHAAPASLKTRSRTPAAPPPPAAPGLSFAAQLCPTAAAGGGGRLPSALLPGIRPLPSPALPPPPPPPSPKHRALRSAPLPPSPPAAAPAPPPLPAVNPSSASARRGPGRGTNGPGGAPEPGRCSGSGAAPTRSPKDCPPLGRLRLPEHQHARVGAVELRAASPAPRFLGLSLPPAPGLCSHARTRDTLCTQGEGR